MSTKKIITSSIVAGAVALAIANVDTADAASKDKEKCYGVVEAGHNDCGDANGNHSCMGQSKVDGDGSEWVAVPKGLCDKLVGGSTEPYEGTTPPSEENKEG